MWFGSYRAVGDMTEEDPANLLVRVDIPDIKTQVINVLLYSSTHFLLFCAKIAVIKYIYRFL